MPSLAQVSEHVSSARRAMDAQDWAAARREWTAVLEDDPEFAPAYSGGANALRELGLQEDADRLLDEGERRFPNDEGIALSRARLAHSRRDWQAALACWEGLRERFPANPWCYLGSAQTMRAAGRGGEVEPLLLAAEELLAAQREKARDASTLLELELQIAKLRQDWPAAQRAVRAALARQATPSARLLLTLAQTCWHGGERDQAEDAAERALSINPTLTEAHVIRAWVATERGDGEAALACYRTLAELNPDTVRWTLKVIQLLNRTGRVPEALNELETMRLRFPDDPMVKVFLENYGPASAALSADAAIPQNERGQNEPGQTEQQELQTLLRKSPDAAHWRRPLLVPNASRDVLIAELSGATTAVLIFTGSNDSVSMPLPLFDRYLATLDVSAIYLKDFNRLRFLTGIKSLGTSYEATLHGLRELLSGMGVARLCTLGNCDGGFAAIRYGVELGADRIVTFGAPTHSPDESYSRIEQARNFMKKRLAENVSGEMLDLKPFLQGRQHGSRIEFFYEEEDARDRIQAEHVSGLRGVTMHPQAGLSNHYLLRRLALTHDDFRATLVSFFEHFFEHRPDADHHAAL